MISGKIVEYLSSNPLTVFNTLLLLFTGYLSYSSYVFQTRTSIRESLEQLDDVEFRKGKLRPMLHSYDHSIIRSACIVELKYYRNGRNPASANQLDEAFRFERHRIAKIHDDMNHGEPFDTNVFLSAVEESIPTLPKVTDTRVTADGIFIDIESSDAVLIRRRTQEVLECVYRTLNGINEETVEELELESEIE